MVIPNKSCLLLSAHLFWSPSQIQAKRFEKQQWRPPPPPPPTTQTDAEPIESQTLQGVKCIACFCGTYIFTCMKVICILSSHAIGNTFLPHIALAPPQPMSGPNQWYQKYACQCLICTGQMQDNFRLEFIKVSFLTLQIAERVQRCPSLLLAGGRWQGWPGKINLIQSW